MLKVGDKVQHTQVDYDRYFFDYPRDEIGVVSHIDTSLPYSTFVDWPHELGRNYPHLDGELMVVEND
jgi:hypothetical protein